MPVLKNILSDSEEKKRAAAFEAQMLAMLAKDKSAAPVVPARDGIQITVTANGQTTVYKNIADVPAPVRQQFLNAWQPAQPPLLVQPVIHSEPSASRPRSRRVAMTLNLILPGAGQFYLGQAVAGSVYAFGFIACFVASIVIFLRDYGGYIEMSAGGDIFGEGNLEKLSQSFHTGVLGVLQIAAIAIYIVSAIHLSRSASR